MIFMLKFIARCLFMVVSVPVLIITAVMEAMYAEPNWVYWKDHNLGLILLLPWSRYRSNKSNKGQ